MKRDIKIRTCDPAGNITIFVLDETPRSDYASVARELLGMTELGGEQVAFVTGPDSMEMCGLEFCGNASRAFALMCAESRGKSADYIEIPVNVSGADDVIMARVDKDASYVEIDMPLQRSVTEYDAEGACGKLVDLGGIIHLVLKDVDADDELFIRLRDKVAEDMDPPAFGVMFCSGGSSFDDMKDTRGITPIVYVRDVDSVYHEGSCASGATAVAIAESQGKPDGEYRYKAKMPAGTLDVTVAVTGGSVTRVSIGSPVALARPQIVTVDI